jgi:hypothetical protein
MVGTLGRALLFRFMVKSTAASHPSPFGHRFAFTILDDTDDSTVANTRPIYDLLTELGLRTTKTLWPLACPEGSRDYFAGQTLADADYLAFCRDLHERGFELTWHGATMESSERDRTEAGLARFHELFGFYPAVHANHGQNLENIYWGQKRYHTPILRWFARLTMPHTAFCGEVPGSPYFWGDVCVEHFRFVRNFTFREINTRKRDPHMPYRLEGTPFANYWFSSSDAPDAAAFKTLVTRASLDRLCAEGGVCILSTHFGKGYVKDDRVDSEIADTFRYLASLPGWFVPVSRILEHLLGEARQRMTGPALRRLELAHVIDRIRGKL